MIKEDRDKEQEILKSLSPTQKRFLDAIDWLYYGPRASGRSYLLCCLILIRVLRNQEGFLSDHHIFHQANDHTLRLLRHLADKYGIKISVQQYGFGYIIKRYEEYEIVTQ